MNTPPIYLSVIVPAYNEQERLENCIECLVSELSGRYLYEIIIVDNGSDDNTQQIGSAASAIYPRVKYVRLNERGKGLAVRFGMLMASGRYRYMCDVDLSTPTKEIHRFIEKARVYDVVIGSREIDQSLVTTTKKRRFIGRVFHHVVRDLVPSVQDTQCGFKMFRDYAAMQIFQNCTINGMAFDVEALHVARLRGFSYCELPVRWHHDPNSRVRLVDDSLNMFLDVIGLYFRRFPSVKNKPRYKS